MRFALVPMPTVWCPPSLQSVSYVLRLPGLLLLLTLCGLAGFPGAAVGAAENDRDPSQVGEMLADVVLNIRHHPADKTDWQTIARDLVRLKAGDRFTPAKLDASLAALAACKRFEDIHADGGNTDAGLVLTFTLTPFRRIKAIRIENAYPLFERDILNRLGIYTGGPFPIGAMEKQAAVVEALYREEGFIAPRAEAAARIDPADGRYRLTLTIHKGTWYSLGDLSFQGNSAFSDSRLKAHMRVWRATLRLGSAARFIEKNLTADIQNLTAIYRAEGYADCRITPVIKRDAARKAVDVSLAISEGPRYRVDFNGNQVFWNLTLKKDLVLFQEGNCASRGVRKTVRNIRKRYHQAGYGEVSVKSEKTAETRDGQPAVHLVFNILEGPRTVVSTIAVNGNQALDAEAIREQMDTRVKKPFVAEILKNDLSAVTELYYRKGFGEVQVSSALAFSPDRRAVEVTLNIKEGPDQRVGAVEITGIDAVPIEQAYAAIALKPEEPFRRYMLKSDENTLAALISEKGFPYVTVAGSASADPDQTRLKLRYEVTQGPAVTIGRIFYAGNLRTRRKLLNREVGLQPGAPFCLKQITTAQRNLRNIDAFSSVQFTTVGLREKCEQVVFFADLEEKKPYFFELGSGFKSDTGFFAGTRLGDSNLFGMNRKATVSGQINQTGHRAELELQDPNLWATRTTATLSLFTERLEKFNQNFETRTYGTSLGFTRKWLKNWTSGVSTRLERRDQIATGDGEITDIAVELGRRTVLVTTPSLQYDTRDSFIRPKKGFFANFAVDVSKGVEKVEDDFLKYRLEGRGFWSPLSHLTLAWIARLGYLDPYGGSGDVPEDQLFYLGGIGDVRGFEENLLRFDANGDAVGGRSSLSGSLEARIDLGYNFDLTLFYDIGRLSDTSGAVGGDDWRDTIGAGLRYITPVGPIGILYGQKLDRHSDESAGQFYFSIGYTF